MSNEIRRRLFINHRNHPELVEALANVPRGTYYKYEALKEQIPKFRSTEYWSNKREVYIHTENFRLQRIKYPELQKLHEFMTKGIGYISKSLPGQTKDKRKIERLLKEIYFKDQKYFRKFFTKSAYVKNWFDYVILVRSLGIYW
jgi:hypothetical protein